MAVVRMRKGSNETDLIVNIVVGVLIIGFLAVMVNYGYQLAAWIEKYIFGKLTAGVPNTELISAIECSYLRCAEGCAATAGISVRFPIGTINCKEHCESAVKAEGITDGKLCGEAAQKHPLMVRISELDSYISTDDMSFIPVCKGAFTCCIVPSEKGTETGLGMVTMIKDTFVKKADVGVGNCPIRLPPSTPFVKCSESETTNCGADTVTLNTGMYYVWTETRSLGTTNVVWDSYTEPIKSANFVCCSNSWRSGIKCTTGTLREAEYCDKDADNSTEACSNKCTKEGYPQSFYGTQRLEGDYMVCTCMDTGAGESEETTTTTQPAAAPGEENLD